MMTFNSFEELLLSTAFYTIACDGDIATEEIQLIQKLVSKSDEFAELKVESYLNDQVALLNKHGDFIFRRFFRYLKSASFDTKQKRKILEFTIELIHADEKVEYSEIRFFKHIKQILGVDDAEVLSIDPNASELLGSEIFEDDLFSITDSLFFHNNIPMVFNDISFENIQNDKDQ